MFLEISLGMLKTQKTVINALTTSTDIVLLIWLNRSTGSLGK
jgi:hypothetical protein